MPLSVVCFARSLCQPSACGRTPQLIYESHPIRGLSFSTPSLYIWLNTVRDLTTVRMLTTDYSTTPSSYHWCTHTYISPTPNTPCIHFRPSRDLLQHLLILPFFQRPHLSLSACLSDANATTKLCPSGWWCSTFPPKHTAAGLCAQRAFNVCRCDMDYVWVGFAGCLFHPSKSRRCRKSRSKLYTCTDVADDVGDVLADAASVLERIVMWWENIQFRALIPLCHRFVTYRVSYSSVFFPSHFSIDWYRKMCYLECFICFEFFSNKIKTILSH